MTEQHSSAVISHLEELRKHIVLEGRRIVDIGSGAGEIGRSLADAGAWVTGVECSPSQLKLARAKTNRNCRLVTGVGQALPLEDSVFEASVFFNSLHHVPQEEMLNALSEAARVVKTGGLVYVAEPLAEGPCFELDSPVDDETEVRKKALGAIHRAREAIRGLEETGEVRYSTFHTYPDFEDYREEMLRFDLSRRNRFEKLEPELKQRFRRIGKPTDDGWCFLQPMRANILRVGS